MQRDGSIVELGAEPEELRRLIEGELLAVQIACLAGLSRIIDWTVLSSRRGAILLSPPVQVRTFTLTIYLTKISRDLENSSMNQSCRGLRVINSPLGDPYFPREFESKFSRT